MEGRRLAAAMGAEREPSAMLQGAIDVLTLRGLARAVAVLAGKREPSASEAFNSALAGTIDLSGAMAKALLGDDFSTAVVREADAER